MTEETPEAPVTPSTENITPLTAWFLGPKAEHGILWQELLSYVFQDYIHWRRNYFPNDPVVISRARRRTHETWNDNLNTHLDLILNSLKAHFPFYSPRYIAHMLSEQTLPSVLGYFAGMLYNPNNVTDEAAPVTVKLEIEVGQMVSAMLGFNPRRSWAHLCSGGTAANIEALWVARTVQFIPFIVREYCLKNKIDYEVKTPNGTLSNIAELSPRELIGLKANESIFMIRKLARHEVEVMGRSVEHVLGKINTALKFSSFNVTLRGLDAVMGKVKMRPIILVSEAGHYSLRKAANLIGYGEDSIRMVPVNSSFRMDMGALEAILTNLKEKEYVAAVVGIVGTTEEGAVDPIHKIHFIQEELSRTHNASFWLHIDAAWGGYIRSVFCGHDKKPSANRQSLEDICQAYALAINAREEVKISIGNEPSLPTGEIRWDNPEIYSAFLAMADADSITVDPHKLGYVPYPAGIVAFRNGLVTELITQKAQYISDEIQGVRSIDEPVQIEAVGPYILEGSKPGAAAAGCWLAHKTIPLSLHGHGKIIKTTLLNSKKLYRYFQYHKKLFTRIDKAICGKVKCVHPFTFVPLFEPDTNVVCFIALPMSWQNNALVPVDMALSSVNEFNRLIYEKLSIPSKDRGTQMPYMQPYFISRTTFEKDQYHPHHIGPMLEKIRVKQKDYAQHGLFVLRSTVMNPLYFTAEHQQKNYLFDFILHLHLTARTVLNEIYKSMM